MQQPEMCLWAMKCGLAKAAEPILEKKERILGGAYSQWISGKSPMPIDEVNLNTWLVVLVVPQAPARTECSPYLRVVHSRVQSNSMAAW